MSEDKKDFFDELSKEKNDQPKQSFFETLKEENSLSKLQPSKLNERSKNAQNLKYCAKGVLIVGIIVFIICFVISSDDMNSFEKNIIITSGFISLITNIILYFVLNVIADISNSLNDINKNKKI